jgi:hypothetical protein
MYRMSRLLRRFRRKLPRNLNVKETKRERRERDRDNKVVRNKGTSTLNFERALHSSYTPQGQAAAHKTTQFVRGTSRFVSKEDKSHLYPCHKIKMAEILVRISANSPETCVNAHGIKASSLY